MTGLDLEAPQSDFDLALEACAMAHLEGLDPLATFGAEAVNMVTSRIHSLSRPSPAAEWWNAHPLHPAIYRVLKIDPSDDAAAFALLPFRLAKIDDTHIILVALPCPRTLGPVDPDWLGIETVLAWDPRANTISVRGDANRNHLVGRVPLDRLPIYGSPFLFFRAYAEARAQFAIQRRSIPGAWHVKPKEPDLTPGLLLIGDPAKVKWPLHRLPDDIECVGCDAQAVNRAMLRQARIPRARQSTLRSAA